ncbi:tetratricopeptide repeat protein [Belliella kenyensis]|uniref:Tetratricopeptide repeat protein n=1 Tax=Belliella kenyensis TaxID=1472724 RepID=A0ABV8ELZ9_9BACT|nr:tetratricopeptide repeat protein [Belliella kenyensis]MCH7403578.1 tetratricopeptide repeat protein [Belliella kenyensis]MDN3603870.1 tetratricopeptide repeat protein [Belliella kenyensis]
MFKLIRNISQALLVVVLLSNCSPKLRKYDNLLDGIVAKPQALTMHRDSVRFKLEGAIPLQYLKSDVRILLYPEYSYGEGALRLAEIVAFDGTYTKIINQAKVEADFVFPYLPGMESGELIVRGLIMQKNKARNVTSKKVADGLYTTPLLARVGQVTPDEPIPPIGVYMKSDFSELQREVIKVHSVKFGLGSSMLDGNTLVGEDGKPILSFVEPGKVLKKVNVVGLHSLEGQELNKPDLAQRRGEAVRQRVRTVINNPNIQVTSSFRYQDWFDLRVLLGDYDGISASQKEEIYNVILSNKSFDTQLRDLQRLSSYAKISRDLFPKLRLAKIELTYENTGFSDPEVAANVHRLLQDGRSINTMTKEQLIYAGELASRLSEKERIYTKLAELYNSELAQNNLGVVYLNMAQRELNLKEKNQLITRAMTNFRQANRMNATSYAFHNLGQAYLLRGDYFEAYVAISEASSLERDETNEFLRFNEGLRGAIDIINGDYKLATIRLNRAPENSHNLFNKGLAYFLAEDYKNALESFEESVQVDRDFGYGFYGLAMVASVSDDRSSLFENLKKAVQRSEFLRERALNDLIFKRFREDQEFLEVFK